MVLSKNDKETITELLNLEIDDLLELICEDLIGNVGIVEYPPSKKCNLAKQWFKNNLEMMRALLCTNEMMIKSNQKNNDMFMIAAIADLLAGLLVNVSPFTVSTYIYKIGIKKVCPDI
ncbi:hypothetical protein ACFLYJ_02255 [Candidatus Cloacimonadota bacterium]